ncbi:MAG: ABC transporter ATP-binding protein, partial [Candidatus Cloacimonetes bacterium]|nr:ABC transporter ATP-binding protein [Candidatus Cloacimonadota bacterium]
MMHGGGGGGGGARGRGFSTDEIKYKIYDRRLFGKMMHYLKPYLKWVVLSFVVLMIISGAEVVLPLIQRSAIDDYIISDKSIAIFNDKASYQDYFQRYHKLKFKEYAYGEQHFIILSAKD